MESGTFQTVSQLTDEIKLALNADFGDVWVTGEVSGLTEPRSGHIYFTLKDNSAQISTVIWRSSVARLRFRPQEGTQILCRGYIDVYPQRGNYQLIARVVQPIGEGSLQIAFRKMHDRLRNEGLFADDHKLPLPWIPQRIAVITSPTGAAIRDFLQVVKRRWPYVDIVVIPTQVQGPEAARQIAEAVKQFGSGTNQFDPDVIVVTRGGGSIEDLSAFNEEIVVRAIYQSKVPVISAVGHEIDVSLSDLVADERALTPTEAGEKLVPNHQEIRDWLEARQSQIRASIESKVGRAKSNLEVIANRHVIRQPLDRIRQLSLSLDSLESRLVENSKRKFVVNRQKLSSYLHRLRQALRSNLPRSKSDLISLVQSSSIRKPLETIDTRRINLEALMTRMQQAFRKTIDQKTNQVQIIANQLTAFSPANVLERGYSLTVDHTGKPITDCNSASPGDTIQTWLGKGKLTSVVDQVQRDAEYSKDG